MCLNCLNPLLCLGTVWIHCYVSELSESNAMFGNCLNPLLCVWTVWIHCYVLELSKSTVMFGNCLNPMLCLGTVWIHSYVWELSESTPMFGNCLNPLLCLWTVWILRYAWWLPESAVMSEIPTIMESYNNWCIYVHRTMYMYMIINNIELHNESTAMSKCFLFIKQILYWFHSKMIYDLIWFHFHTYSAPFGRVLLCQMYFLFL